jgi:hypothetical protein
MSELQSIHAGIESNHWRVQENKVKPFLFAILIATLCLQSQADEWGSFRGQIVVDGEIPERQLLIAKDADIKDKEICAAEDHYAEDLLIDKESRGLANVFVYLAKKPKSVHPDLVESATESLTVTYKGCQLVPHCLICRTDQRLEIGSDDGLAHNPHNYPVKNPASGVSLASNSTFRIKLNLRIAESNPFAAGCDYHSWIRGYWLIVDHPYAALTDKDGKFQIDQLPVGEHIFKIWHERPGYLERSFKFTVTAGEPIEPRKMKLNLARLEKPTATK